nr:MAG TPA: hypothetical protein [Caudoviricetes sp.]
MAQPFQCLLNRIYRDDRGWHHHSSSNNLSGGWGLSENLADDGG